MKNKNTFEEIMNEYKTLSDSMRTFVRGSAVRSLQSYGVEEIGTSDVNNEIAGLYNTYGSFEGIIRHGLDLVRSH
jgi:hypothetical protein